MAQNKYIAGVCNIGPEETRRRRILGWVSLAITPALLVTLVWIGVNPWWRILVFFPATMSASGFLQAHFHFCSGFAHRGIFNFGPIGERQEVADELSKKMDKRMGIRITLSSVLIGAAIAMIGVVLV
jgi:hypothetical protein